ncbi:hypothetical protein E3J49_04595 [Candidatus Bathyarchaeota archaeon]|nr:MAG: hypothetical protein E3J49_04595 [Candidatus Bathyarchaeota archaeon]
MYDRDFTETSKGALVELGLALGRYKENIVLVGGWPPYFLTSGHFDHCGSVDVDFVLKPSIVIKYESIRNIVENLGYGQTSNIFRFEKNLRSSRTDRQYVLHLDFLTEPGAAKEIIQREQLITVQEDLKACLIEGSSIVFNFNYEEIIEGTIPDNGEAVSPLSLADIVGSLSMKGQALRGRFKQKDFYDIYAVSGFHKGNPLEAGKAFVKSVRDQNFVIENSIVQSSLSTIRNSFSNISRVGPQMVSRFIGSDTSTDAFERVNAFLKVVGEVF